MAKALDDNFKALSLPKYRQPFNDGVRGEIDTIVDDDFVSAHTLPFQGLIFIFNPSSFWGHSPWLIGASGIT